MPRPPNIDRPTVLNISLPETLRAKLDVFLFNKIEGKVPYGAYNRFFIERLTEFFAQFEVSNAQSRETSGNSGDPTEGPSRNG